MRKQGHGKFCVFEGVDGCGKTTLAYRLARKTDAFLVNCGPPPIGKAFETWRAGVEFAAYDSRCPVIFDRLHWGDYAYGTLYRESELGVRGICLMDELITKIGGFVVYVRVTGDTANARIDARGEERHPIYEQREGIDSLVKMYDEVALASVERGNRVHVIENDPFVDTDATTDYLKQMLEGKL